MSLSVITPPTIHELLQDPAAKALLLKAPKLPGNTAEPFRVWGIRHDDKWAGKLFPDYRSAFDLVRKMIKDRDTYADVVITCRPVAFARPQSVHLPPGTDWCGHCRRPTVYRRMRSHAAMKKWPVVEPDPDIKRCWYCAARGPQRMFLR